MSWTDVAALLPFIIMAAAAAVIMLAIAFYRDHRLTVVLTLVGLALAFASLPFVSPLLPRRVTLLLVMDGYAIFYIGLLLATTFMVVILSYGYLESYDGNREEYYLLLLLATLGSAVLVASDHFASFFLGLEILSVSLYVLIAYAYLQEHRIEAGIKYLILAAAAAAFLLFGMALIYADLGTMAFSSMALTEMASGGVSPILLAGLGLLMVGIGFKLALVPFHLWTPDVYQGAPAPVTGFVATVSKGGVLVLMLRFFSQLNFHDYPQLTGAFTIMAVLSMLAGNLLALLQSNVKRILAYSSIAHLGYLLVPFLARGALAQSAIAFYLVAYFTTTLSAFGVVTVLSTFDREVEELAAYRGLFWRRPWLAVIFTAALFSLAGIPPTAGLVAKIFIAAAGVQSALWLPLIVLVVASIIGVFYYARLAIALYRRPEEEEGVTAVPSLHPSSAVALGLLTALVIWLGVYPGPVFELITAVVQRLI